MPPEAAQGSLRDALLKGADTLGVALNDAQGQALLGYLALMQKWNGVYNLTAVRQPAEMLTHHLLDSLAVLPPLRRHLGGRAARILDVGSGGGLPGVVLAILEPQLEVTCVDSVGKKAIFIRQVGVELKLPNLGAVHARVEDLRLPPFDVVTSRAFASLVDFTRLTRHLVGEQGVWMALKGKTPDDEIAALPPEWAVFHVEQLTVPGLDAERCLVWLRRATAA
ncbi:16S rRNA (guanine(527)-N(7))-methyltransferase RsmG [Piscinibacter sp. HJYY11]|uniref:16S rRNA (guanine(527)-N(7))-methyltransferase RsmG n=1 Tax=Piscinibacter sp. HJYY11 TaxID=2801333 RepID=UPI00191F05AC|nr:16S rRNA (guanine(527)-N(7))-methyltransferase RsmG [Piscinibacter sp. HJYY11]MBL0729149.1 16S rRNA (guanine(527)-N(7))-methyltransferase RsmG [Piscinibacter sp. HJYY11]